MSELDVDHDLDRKPSRWLWVCAALGALTLHLGGAALAIAHLKVDDYDDGLGAAGVEIAFEMASPKVTEENLPPGPETDASIASPQLSEQKAEVKETDLPKDTPTETEEPDRVVTENEAKKPEEDDPKVQKVQTQASTESVAQEATARQTLDENAPQAETAKAPNAGIGKDKQRLAAEWAKQISAYFELHKRYPQVKKHKTASVKVNLVLNRLGNVVSVGVMESSGDPAFDEAAISMIRRSDPVPRPPAALTQDTFAYSLNVNFNERK
ncbi:energy transducer TonB [Bradyrhizobium lablabi]|uniref:TonB family protein n=1 Tax=Bradyrhizobium lablabi TaxID=722472 RepID=UPI001BACDE79|nr:TonB family protein [Bradyrhizobium lablabi]MBR1121767.1 energy transducer TonB [Bradyrhizobium lablabi]